LPGRRRLCPPVAFFKIGLVAAEGLGLYRRRATDPALRPKRSRRAELEIGAIAQLGERFNGIEEVVGSIPSGSTTHSPETDISACDAETQVISAT
jgi:hypothetical protein